MTLAQFCEKIALPDQVVERVLSVPEVPEALLVQLRTPELWPLGRAAVKAYLKPDDDGFGELAAQLQCALKTRETYRFSEEIFVETMKCFTRFVTEHLESYGRYGFDRGFWTVRQLSGVLFRIGELEYEIREDAIHLHIPSDAVLEPERLRRSGCAAAGRRPGRCWGRGRWSATAGSCLRTCRDCWKKIRGSWHFSGISTFLTRSRRIPSGSGSSKIPPFPTTSCPRTPASSGG